MYGSSVTKKKEKERKKNNNNNIAHCDVVRSPVVYSRRSCVLTHHVDIQTTRRNSFVASGRGGVNWVLSRDVKIEVHECKKN